MPVIKKLWKRNKFERYSKKEIRRWVRRKKEIYGMDRHLKDIMRYG